MKEGVGVCVAITIISGVSVIDLEVYVLNTEMEVRDLHFPHSYDSDSTIHLSAATIKQYSRNGQCPAVRSPPTVPSSWTTTIRLNPILKYID